MADRVRFPGYSTLDKRNSPSWNEATRFVVEKRLYNPPPRRFFTDEEWPILIAVCDRIIPQTGERVPIENFVDQKMTENQGDGYQQAGEPSMQEMWRRGLHAIEEEARLRFGESFIDLPGGGRMTCCTWCSVAMSERQNGQRFRPKASSRVVFCMT